MSSRSRSRRSTSIASSRSTTPTVTRPAARCCGASGRRRPPRCAAPGPAAGGAVLPRFGTPLLLAFRGEDVVGRWGGEEFVVGMYGMSGADADKRLGDVLATLRRERFERSGGEGFGVSFSAGDRKSV